MDTGEEVHLDTNKDRVHDLDDNPAFLAACPKTKFSIARAPVTPNERIWSPEKVECLIYRAESGQYVHGYTVDGCKTKGSKAYQLADPLKKAEMMAVDMRRSRRGILSPRSVSFALARLMQSSLRVHPWEGSKVFPPKMGKLTRKTRARDMT